MKKNQQCDCEKCLDIKPKEKELKLNLDFFLLTKNGIGIILFIFAIALKSEPLKTVLYLCSFGILAIDIIIKAFINIFNKKFLDENFLMTLATAAAIITGQYLEACAIVCLYQIGEFFSEIAVKRSKKSIYSLMDFENEFVNLYKNGKAERVLPKNVKVNDVIIIKPGEKILLDGIILEGSSSLDCKTLTGETNFYDVTINDEVYSGSVNYNGLLTVKITKAFEDSTLNKILDLLNNISKNSSKQEKFISEFAKFYTPVVVICSVLLFIVPPLILGPTGEIFTQWLNRALIFLVISCPCALVISVPLSYFCAAGILSKNGILVKGGNDLFNLAKTDAVVFDKTGTLTLGTLKVVNVYSENITSEKLLKFCAYCESVSNHPVAKSIVEKYGPNIDRSKISDAFEIAGFGIKCKIENDLVLCGNLKLMQKNKIAAKQIASPNTIVYIAVNNEFAGYIELADEVKENLGEILMALQKLNINKKIILSGDNNIVTQTLAKKFNFDEYYAGLLPNQKVEVLTKLQIEFPNLIYVGDGINDAPCLKTANVGIAMGGISADITKQAADIIILNDNLEKIEIAVKTSKKAKNIVLQNIIFALAVKFAVMILGAIGVIPLIVAVFADVGVNILCVLNSIRLLFHKQKEIKESKF